MFDKVRRCITGPWQSRDSGTELRQLVTQRTAMGVKGIRFLNRLRIPPRVLIRIREQRVSEPQEPEHHGRSDEQDEHEGGEKPHARSFSSGPRFPGSDELHLPNRTKIDETWNIPAAERTAVKAGSIAAAERTAVKAGSIPAAERTAVKAGSIAAAERTAGKAGSIPTAERTGVRAGSIAASERTGVKAVIEN